MVLESIDSAS